MSIEYEASKANFLFNCAKQSGIYSDISRLSANYYERNHKAKCLRVTQDLYPFLQGLVQRYGFTVERLVDNYGGQWQSPGRLSTRIVEE